MMRRIILSLCMLGVVVDSSHAMAVAPRVAAPTATTKAQLVTVGKVLAIFAVAAAAGYAVYEREAIASWFSGEMQEKCLSDEQAALEAFDKLTQCRAELSPEWAAAFNAKVVEPSRSAIHGCDADVRPIASCDVLRGFNAATADRLATCMKSKLESCEFYTAAAKDKTAMEALGFTFIDKNTEAVEALPDATVGAVEIEALTEELSDDEDADDGDSDDGEDEAAADQE